jgi:GNAT superfamily N-acetyltransferase
MIELIEVTNQKQLKKFIYLPKTIYKDFRSWVPPLFADEWNFHNPEKNESLKSSKVIRLMAVRNKELVGRIMGIIHEKYNAVHEPTARFYQLDCINDREVFESLLKRIEQWAKQNKLNKIIGPYGFSDKDPQGYQVEGFEHHALISTPSHPHYLPQLLEQQGYQKEVDCVSYLFDIPQQMPEVYKRVSDRVLSRGELRLIECKSKSELKPYIVPVFRLVNEAYASIFGFVPMSETEMVKFAAQYLPILDPHLVKIIVNKNNDVVAFVVSMPNMSRGLQKAKGELFPFGFISILLSMRYTTQLDLLLGAVKPRYRGLGLTALLATSLLATARKKGLKQIDSHLILEENKVMRAECENLNGKVHKRYRVFSKVVSGDKV